MSMNDMTPFKPGSALSLFEPLRALDELFRGGGFDPAWAAMDAASGIRMDIRETDKDYEIEADIPGMKKEDIKVAVDGRQVSLTAQSEQSQRQDRDGLLWSERHAGQWYRSFTLPQEVDEGQAQARYEDGVLRLTLPKRAGAGGTRLTIQ